ncbi:MAG: uroporphyrinogen-III synthase [Ignavibacteriales bacterium]|nr:uroporphyrinogen-III synthase [Ignavibacteriales bacterium]
MNLSGKTILITRASNQTSEFIDLINANGGVAVCFPTIEIHPPDDWDMIDKAIERMYMYDGIIFTSQNGVLFFFERINHLHTNINLLDNKTIFAVGEKTKQVLVERGISSITVPDKHTAFDLSRLMKEENLQGKCYLFPKGDIANEMIPATLKSLGASVDDIVVYRTLPPSDVDVKNICAMLDGNKIDVVTFTSPSTVKNFFRIIGENGKKYFNVKPRIAVIGPATAGALEEFNLEPDILPAKPSIEAMIESIILYFNTHE